MAEVLGLLSSLVACYEILAPAIKFCGQLYKAPREVKALQDQINVFDALIKSIEKSGSPAGSPLLVSALDDGRTVVKEVNNFIAAKFNNGHMYRKSCYTSWARNRKRFMRLGEKLERNRSRIKEAILAEVYINLQPSPVMSTHDKVSALQTAPPDSQSHSHKLRSLNSLEDPEADHYDDVCTGQATTSHSMSCNGGLSEDHGCQTCKRGNNKLIPTSNTTLTFRPQLECDLNPRIPMPGPVSVFESLSSFRPELYAENADKRILYTYFVEETQPSAFLRVTECALFYLSAPRQWTRVTASITTMRDSAYWAVTKSRKTSLGIIGNYDLPIALNSKVEAYLATYTGLTQDCHLDIFIGHDTQQDKASTKRDQSIQLKKCSLHLSVQQLLGHATEAFAHSGLPWYEEKQLDMRQAYRFNYPDNFFYAWLESRWVYACRFSTEPAHVNIDLYSLAVLYAVKGSPGVAQLLGVFSSKPGTGIISGFLVELPARGKWKTVQNIDSIGGKEHLMQRKLRWCKDLLQGLASIHKRGLIAGGMFGPGCRVGIDSEDRAIFYGGFSTQIDTFGMRNGMLPPEYQSLTVSNGHMNGTYRTDLYHIGFIMWTILENQMWPSPCTLASCPTPPDTLCTTSHPDPIQLRCIDQSIPGYMRKVISICRSEDPLNRLPAWKLLEMFPEDMASSVRIPRDRETDRLTRLEDCYKVYRCIMSCCRCGDVTTQHQYHCNLCGDYDICPKCFGVGYHCRDSSHWLREYFRGIKDDRYWTSRDATGHRQLVTL